MAINKKLIYTIEAKLVFGMDEDIEINDILETMRGIGSANVTDVKIVDSDDVEDELDT